MFNFNLMNKALTDTNVSDSEFRTLYLIVNNCSLNETVSIEMYNAFLMEKLHFQRKHDKALYKGIGREGVYKCKKSNQKETTECHQLTTIKNECTDETTNAVRNEVTNDTLYNNIDNNR